MSLISIFGDCIGHYIRVLENKRNDLYTLVRPSNTLVKDLVPTALKQLQTNLNPNYPEDEAESWIFSCLLAHAIDVVFIYYSHMSKCCCNDTENASFTDTDWFDFLAIRTIFERNVVLW